MSSINNNIIYSSNLIPEERKRANSFDNVFHNSNNTNISSAIFNKTNLIFILWFLGIYIIAYLLIGIIFTKSNAPSSFQLYISRSIDIIVLFFLLFFLFSVYYYNTEVQREFIFQHFLTMIYNFLDDPISIVSTLFFIIIFYAIISIFHIPMSSDSKSVTISLIESIAWILFVILCFIDFFKYILGISFIDLLSNVININYLPSGSSLITAIIPINNNTSGNNTAGNITANVISKEVFNISNNLYTYDDAQAICSSYGATLATYDQIENAYNDGAEWCNYGWSDGQMAYFPTQKSTWDKLQKTTNRKNDCGRPGVNGGYMANPYIKFGVNCYGKKPPPSDSDLARMKENNIDPINPNDTILNDKVQFWKNNSNLLVLNSFDHKKWSEF
jgi:hypothetical protein